MHHLATILMTAATAMECGPNAQLSMKRAFNMLHRAQLNAFPDISSLVPNCNMHVTKAQRDVTGPALTLVFGSLRDDCRPGQVNRTEERSELAAADWGQTSPSVA